MYREINFPAKKYTHKSTKRLLSDESMHITKKCKNSGKMKIRILKLRHSRMPNFRIEAYHQHPSINPSNPYFKKSKDYNYRVDYKKRIEDAKRYFPKYNKKEYTPIPIRYQKYSVPEKADIKHIPEKQLYLNKENIRSNNFAIKNVECEYAVFLTYFFY